MTAGRPASAGSVRSAAMAARPSSTPCPFTLLTTTRSGESRRHSLTSRPMGTHGPRLITACPHSSTNFCRKIRFQVCASDARPVMSTVSRGLPSSSPVPATRAVPGTGAGPAAKGTGSAMAPVPSLICDGDRRGGRVEGGTDGPGGVSGGDDIADPVVGAGRRAGLGPGPHGHGGVDDAGHGPGRVQADHGPEDAGPRGGDEPDAGPPARPPGGRGDAGALAGGPAQLLVEQVHAVGEPDQLGDHPA